MPTVTIDGQTTEVDAGATLLDAATNLGIEIPTLCHLKGLPEFTSCKVCVVRDVPTDTLVPACSTRANDGMHIDTQSAKARDARRAMLQLMLSDHVGDCEGPCTLACPAHMNIPVMLRQIAEQRFADALITVKQHIPLPAILGRICPAPCEGRCRRKQIDAPVSICILKRFVADVDLEQDAPYVPACAPDTEQRIAIVGSGPTGLTAAYYLRQSGHACTLFEAQDALGGGMRAIAPDTLPVDVLDTDIAHITQMGVDVRTGAKIGSPELPLSRLQTEFDAILLAMGSPEASVVKTFGVEMHRHRIKVEDLTYRTSIDGLFAAGASVAPSKVAITSVAAGREAAIAIDQYVRGLPVRGEPQQFNCRIGRLQDTEKPIMLAQASNAPRRTPSHGVSRGYTEQEAVGEAQRCLHCDCRKADSCGLRTYATEYDAKQKRLASDTRRPFEQRTDHPDLVFEQGKCILCGLCIRTTEQDAEPLGLSFVNRGMDTRIAVPFEAPLSQGITTTAGRIHQRCPTGAFSHRDGERG